MDPCGDGVTGGCGVLLLLPFKGEPHVLAVRLRSGPRAGAVEYPGGLRDAASQLPCWETAAVELLEETRGSLFVTEAGAFAGAGRSWWTSADPIPGTEERYRIYACCVAVPAEEVLERYAHNLRSAGSLPTWTETDQCCLLPLRRMREYLGSGVATCGSSGREVRLSGGHMTAALLQPSNSADGDGVVWADAVALAEKAWEERPAVGAAVEVPSSTLLCGVHAVLASGFRTLLVARSRRKWPHNLSHALWPRDSASSPEALLLAKHTKPVPVELVRPRSRWVHVVEHEGAYDQCVRRFYAEQSLPVFLSSLFEGEFCGCRVQFGGKFLRIAGSQSWIIAPDPVLCRGDRWAASDGRFALSCWWVHPRFRGRPWRQLRRGLAAERADEPLPPLHDPDHFPNMGTSAAHKPSLGYKHTVRDLTREDVADLEDCVRVAADMLGAVLGDRFHRDAIDASFHYPSAPALSTVHLNIRHGIPSPYSLRTRRDHPLRDVVAELRRSGRYEPADARTYAMKDSWGMIDTVMRAAGCVRRSGGLDVAETM
eukprot:TRINITY_DN9833_c1_g1_i3.p1 TRINITY_DN9833_c1_g1~~TRINITY_DN9833_c1_g1_i3.p1  ORF type:complete len:581 (+),score=133.32 TRINITY_DN9833_c1_g1_i3:122-1744(+)